MIRYATDSSNVLRCTLMELPLISNSPATAPDALVRAVKRVEAILARTGAEEQQLAGASVYASAERAGIAAVNRAFDLQVPDDEDADAVLGEIADAFGDSTCSIMDTNDKDWSPALADAVNAQGLRRQVCTVHVLQGYATPTVDASLQIIPARAAYGETRKLFLAQAAATNLPVELHDAFADTCIDFLDESRVDCFLARRDRQPVGAISLLTLGNIGVLTDLFTLDAESGGDRGDVAGALLARMVDHCQRAQFEQVITRTTEHDPCRAFLEQRGFQPRVQYDRFVK